MSQLPFIPTNWAAYQARLSAMKAARTSLIAVEGEIRAERARQRELKDEIAALELRARRGFARRRGSTA